MPETVSVNVSVSGPDDNATVEDWAVKVPVGTEEKVITPDSPSIDLGAGTYKFRLTKTGGSHSVPDGAFATKEVVVAQEGDELVAKEGGSPLGIAGVHWRLSSAEDGTAVGPLMTPAAALMAILTVTFWTFVILLDQDEDGLGSGMVLGIGILGGLVALVPLGLRRRVTKRSGEPFPRLGDAVPVAVGFVLILAALGLDGAIRLDEGTRFTIATGGIALAAFTVGLVRFDTIKAAAAVPMVVLFIGITVWPAGAENVDVEISKSLITWIGVILGASALGEAAQQVTQNTANGRVLAAQAAAGVESASPANAAAATAPQRGASGSVVPRPEGDLRRS